MENAGNVINPTKSSLSLNGRTTLNMSGVKKVKSTEPNRVIAVLDNCLVIISGSNLSVQNLSLSTGMFDLTGMVTSIQYTNSVKRKFSLRNIFK